jgi:hypothetical protein
MPANRLLERDFNENLDDVRNPGSSNAVWGVVAALNCLH